MLSASNFSRVENYPEPPTHHRGGRVGFPRAVRSVATSEESPPRSSLTTETAHFEAWARGLLAAFDLMCCGGALVKTGARVVCLNKSMMGFLERGLRRCGERLRIDHPESDRVFQQL